MADLTAHGWIRRKHTFQPRLTLEHTGYSGESRWQWCLAFVSSHGRTAEGGLRCADEASVAEVWREARDFLCRIGAKPLGVNRG